ncbi:defensin, isoforms B and C-like [Coccinella septempunctata]|uniref:defensin, isoforms B and C-like n=1 Tax=Coccinella septempunctata TaxID=41139 RepID=UPI001D098297|nr:defensin, isoforms B and C-like [Coccinella septempunctata]
MKFTLFSFFAVLLFIGMAQAIQPSDTNGPTLKRFRRFTCDALSFEAGSVKVNHAACAIHCASLHYRGGYCNDKAVCVCRR